MSTPSESGELFLPTGLREAFGMAPEVAAPVVEALLHDPDYFYELLEIKDQQSPLFIPFTPTPFQRRLLRLLLSGVKQIIVVKARQIGCTTAVRAWQFREAYLAMNAVRHAMLSYKEDAARDAHQLDVQWLERINANPLLARRMGKATQAECTFAETRAELVARTSGGRGGMRGASLSSLHLTEFAFYHDPDEVLAQMSALVQGVTIIESTPNVPGDAFHRLAAGAPANGWTLVTSWWFEHPSYVREEGLEDDEWAMEALTYGERAEDLFDRLDDVDERVLVQQMIEIRDPAMQDYDLLYDIVLRLRWRRWKVATLTLPKFRREFPSSLEEAFVTKESRFFDGLALTTIDTTGRQPAAPVPGHRYVMGVDVSGGVGQDYSALHVVDAETRDVVYYERTNTTAPRGWAERVMTVANRYNGAYVLVESNNHGHLVLGLLTEWRYPNQRLYYNEDGKPWVTTTKSKIEAMQRLREYVDGELISWLPAETRLELASLEIRSVTPEAPVGQHDDLAMSLALTYTALSAIPRGLVPLESAGVSNMSPHDVRAALDKLLPPVKQQTSRRPRTNIR